jgi:low temperature requirement protein LtrA
VTVDQPSLEPGPAGDPADGKRVSWAELYFDLVFVFAVSQVTHEMVTEPHTIDVFRSLGLFLTLWWTWIGFVILYNRQGDDRRTGHRLVLLAGTVPCAVVATQAHEVFEGHALGFVLALAGARVLLAIAYRFTMSDPAGNPRFRRHISLAYGGSAVLFAASAAIASPWRYPCWAVALFIEGSVVLLGERTRPRRGLGRPGRPGRDAEGRSNRVERMREFFTTPVPQGTAVDPKHLAERFGQFVIILLGEIVVSVGSAALIRPHHDVHYWLSLLGGLVLTGALWWIYFDSAAELNERLLAASGGNPTLAYSLYAAGHLVPAFALLVVAAGVNLSLHDHPPAAASWLVTCGMVAYLMGTRVFDASDRRWWIGILRILTLAGTVCLALLHRVVDASVVVAIVAGWAVVAAAGVSVLRRGFMKRMEANPFAFLGE